MQVCKSRKSVSAIEDLDSKTIAMLSPVKGPLILSGSRGLACVLSTMQRAAMYDLEEEDAGQPDGD